jgi:hypothetical protein
MQQYYILTLAALDGTLVHLPARYLYTLSVVREFSMSGLAVPSSLSECVGFQMWRQQ